MGSDLYMEARNRPCPPPPPLSVQAQALEDRVAELEERIGKVIAEKERLAEQARQDAQTIAELTRERDAALRVLLVPADTGEGVDRSRWCNPGQVEYDAEGYNSFGTKYHAACENCGSGMSTNMLGMGTCPACGTRRNPMA